MTKFNEGDRVVVINAEDKDDFKVGDIGTVVALWDEGNNPNVPYPYFVRFDGGCVNLLVGPDEIRLLDEPDTTAEQDAIDRAFARGYDEGYAQGVEDGFEQGFNDGSDNRDH